MLVYGVDERFWRFHGLEPREGVSASRRRSAAELGAAAGDVLLTRLQKPSEIPLESLFARKEDIARTVRLTLTAALPRESLGEFSLQPQQGDVRAVFAPLRRLQRDLAAAGKVNTVLVQDSADDAAVNAAFQRAVTLDDIGVRRRRDRRYAGAPSRERERDHQRRRSKRPARRGRHRSRPAGAAAGLHLSRQHDSHRRPSKSRTRW